MRNICHEIIEDYNRGKNLDHPCMDWVIKQLENHETGFSSHYLRKNIRLEAGSEESAIFGLHQLSTAVKSGHSAEYFGKWKPRFACRPLWLGAEVNIELCSHTSLAVPSAFIDSSSTKFHQFCKRILELGYNSILIGKRDHSIDKNAFAEKIDFTQLCQTLHEYHLKLIVKPHFSYPQGMSKSPKDPAFSSFIRKEFNSLVSFIPSVDFVFWESELLHSDCQKHPSVKEFTQADLALCEVSLIEEALENKIGLIYSIPSPDYTAAEEQIKWIPSLCDDVANKTIIAFSAVAGHPCSDHLSPHPLWNVLKRNPDESATGLMPIVNIGSVWQGEGLWPCLPLDLIDDYFSKCTRHHFAGVISLINHLPSQRSLLDCSLWTAGQVQWKPNNAQFYAETWFEAFHPQLSFSQHKDSLKKMRQIALDLSFIRSLSQEKQRDHLTTEACRAIGESLLSRLKELQIYFERDKKFLEKRKQIITWEDYFNPFALDARRMVANFFHAMRLPSMQIKQEQLLGEGLWTQSSPSGSPPFSFKPLNGVN